MTFAVYSRKSRTTERGESIENQVELCRRYIENYFGKGNTILIYEDEGFSGGTTNRPAFLRLFAEAEEVGITHVVCYRLDRISRSIGDFARLIEDLSSRGIEFISIKEQFDTQTPIGRAMMYIASVFSQLERETIAERIRDNMSELAKTGRWLGGRTPLGFKSVKKVSDKGKKHVYFKLESIEEQLATVKYVYSTYEELGTLSGTERALKAQGLMTQNNKVFSRLAIKKILENPVYAVADNDTYNYFKAQGSVLCGDTEDYCADFGIMAFHKTKNSPKGKKIQTECDISDWIIAVGEHRGVIEGKRWVNVQRLLKQGSCIAAGRKAKEGRGRLGLLAGCLVCPDCGNKMSVKAGSANGTYYYCCSLKLHSRRACCRAENVNGAALDDFVIDAASQRLAEAASRLPREARRKIEQSFSEYAEGFEARPRREILEKEIALQKLYDALAQTKGSSAADAISLGIKKLSHELELLRKKAYEPKENYFLSEDFFSPSFSCSKASVIKSMIKALNIEQQRAVIFCILQKVIIVDKKLEI